MQMLSETELLEIASKDIDGYDLLKYIAKKYPTLHPNKHVEVLSEILNDKRYKKLIANLITIKLQRIRSQVLKQTVELLDAGTDIDILKTLDKLLGIVTKFSNLDDEEQENKSRIFIQYRNTDKQEEF